MEQLVGKFGELSLLNAVEGLTWGYVRVSKPTLEVSQFEMDQEELLAQARCSTEVVLSEKYEMEAREMVSMAEGNFDVEALENPAVQEYLAEQRAQAARMRFRGWQATFESLSTAWEQTREASLQEQLQFVCDHSAAALLPSVLPEGGTAAVVDAGADGKLLGEALLLAAQSGDVAVAGRLLQHDSGLLTFSRKPENATTCSGYLAVHFAADSGNAGMLRCLIAAAKGAGLMEAMLDARVFSRRPIATGGSVGVVHLAANSGSLECIQAVLDECNAERVGAAEQFGRSALEIIICNACTNTAEDSHVVGLIKAFTDRGSSLPEDVEEVLEDEGLESGPRAQAVIALVSSLLHSS